LGAEKDSVVGRRLTGVAVLFWKFVTVSAATPIPKRCWRARRQAKEIVAREQVEEGIFKQKARRYSQSFVTFMLGDPGDLASLHASESTPHRPGFLAGGFYTPITKGVG
jgi:hypothetical protein